MNINEAFPSKYLKAHDLRGSSVVVTISHVEMQNIGDERKAVLFFKGKDKGLVLNKTCSNALIEILGSADTDEWEDKRVMLYPTKVDFQGKRVDAIRVDAPPKSKADPAPPPPPADEGESVPF